MLTNIFLLCNQGDTIQPSVRNFILKRFIWDLTKGRVYYDFHYFDVVANGGQIRTTRHSCHLNLENETIARPVIFQTFLKMVFFDKYLSCNYNFIILYFIGLMCGVGFERDYENKLEKFKYNVIELDMKLWKGYSFQLQCVFVVYRILFV